MASSDSFPAIARAKQRFLQRQKPIERRSDGLIDAKPSDGVMQWMARLGSGLDGDLALIHDDVERIHAAVARDYASMNGSVDAFTSELLSGRGRVELRRRKELGKKVVRLRGASVVVRKPRIMTAVKVRPSGGEMQSLTVELSRAARLAKEAVSATTIQRAVRRILYTTLYTGGLDQLRRARTLRVQYQLRYWLRRWQIFISRKRRLRRKLRRSEENIHADLSQRCRIQARAVMEIDGKYGLAKEFHRLRLVASVLLAWVHAVTCEGEACCSDNSEEHDDEPVS